MAISSSLLSRSGSLQRRNSRRTAPAFPAPAQLFGSIRGLDLWSLVLLYGSMVSPAGASRPDLSMPAKATSVAKRGEASKCSASEAPARPSAGR